MKKKVAVVSVADAEEAARLADLPLEATVALADVAGAIKDGLLAFASATGLVVMHQMMEAELTEGDRREARQDRGPRAGRKLARQRQGFGRARRTPGQHRAPAGPQQRRRRDRARHLEGVQLGRPAQLPRRRAHAGRGGHPAPRRRGRAGRSRARGALQVDVQVGGVAALRGGDHQGHGRADGPEPL